MRKVRRLRAAQRSRWKLADAISFCDLITDQIRHKHRIEFIWIENTDGELFTEPTG